MDSTSDIPRGQVKVGKDSFHFQLYQYGTKHGRRKKRGYRENLCHYMRVVMIWAPLLWFFVVPLGKKESRTRWLRPWMITLAILVGAFGWYTVSTWPEQTWEYLKDALILTGLLVVGAAILAGCIIFIDKNSQTLARAFKWILHPLDVVLMYFIDQLELLWFGYIKPGSIKVWKKVLRPPLRWFFLRAYFRYAYPWAFLIIGVLTGAYWLYTDRMIQATIVTLIICAAVVIGVGIVIGMTLLLHPAEYNLVGKMKNHFADKEAQPPVVVKDHGTSILRIIWRFILAKKYKICPFIILPDDTNGFPSAV